VKIDTSFQSFSEPFTEIALTGANGPGTERAMERKFYWLIRSGERIAEKFNCNWYS